MTQAVLVSLVIAVAPLPCSYHPSFLEEWCLHPTHIPIIDRPIGQQIQNK